jgi:hypothetical protein
VAARPRIISVKEFPPIESRRHSIHSRQFSSKSIHRRIGVDSDRNPFIAMGHVLMETHTSRQAFRPDALGGRHLDCNCQIRYLIWHIPGRQTGERLILLWGAVWFGLLAVSGISGESSKYRPPRAYRDSKGGRAGRPGCREVSRGTHPRPGTPRGVGEGGVGHIQTMAAQYYGWDILVV